MTTTIKIVSAVALTACVGLTVAAVAGQDPPAPRHGPSQGRGRGAPLPPPEPQAGHPTGKLVIWGDLANFDPPGTPLRCYTSSRFKRGQRVGFRMTAVDGGSGDVENTAVMVAHVTYSGMT